MVHGTFAEYETKMVELNKIIELSTGLSVFFVDTFWFSYWSMSEGLYSLTWNFLIQSSFFTFLLTLSVMLSNRIFNFSVFLDHFDNTNSKERAPKSILQPQIIPMSDFSNWRFLHYNHNMHLSQKNPQCTIFPMVVT